MASEFSREDTFILLNSMGISLPETTKISDDDLNKRLGQALDAAQRLRIVIEATPFNPTDYPIWPTDRIHELLGATSRMSFKEIITSSMASGPGTVSSDKRDMFQNMRNVVMGIAQGFGTTRDFCMTEQTGDLKNCGLYVRLSEVYRVNDAPVYILLYKELTLDEKQSVPESLDKYIGRGKLISTVQTTEFEQAALLRLFRLNSKRLSPDFHPVKDKDYRKLGLKMTFILPLGAISLHDARKLTDNVGCEVCGKKKINRCAQCLSVAYCGTECQKKDWPNHKSTCRSLEGGTWKTLTFEVSPSLLINNRETYNDALARQTSRETGAQVPLDIHNGKIFLVKFQIPILHLKSEQACMFFYDRQRSFDGRWERRGQHDLFDEMKEGMGSDWKMYRWARRVGDFQLSVCFDRLQPKIHVGDIKLPLRVSFV